DLGARVLRLGLRSHWCGSFPVHHPIERVSLRRFLATAALFRCDAIFNRRQPGYLARTGEQLRLGPLTVRHLRRRIGIVAAAGMTAGVVARCPRVAAAVPLAAGFALNAVHLRALRRAGEPIRLRALFSPRDISAHAVWAVVAGMARAAGEASVLVQRGSGKGCESV
ncbi:MAG TPA: hypothetical protein VE219_01080, partial [Candidatus Sulfotelmatobacter sp.]|nr:hypothetical protein [Candidatus Sulfotelmatobacter sp.]